MGTPLTWGILKLRQQRNPNWHHHSDGIASYCNVVVETEDGAIAIIHLSRKGQDLFPERYATHIQSPSGTTDWRFLSDAPQWVKDFVDPEAYGYAPRGSGSEFLLNEIELAEKIMEELK